MAWQDVFPVSSPRIDAEEDREQRLAAQARAGADWALTALVARYQPPVTRYLTRLTGNADLGRALAARVFIRMERRLHGPEAGRHLRLWLLRASTEAGLDALRTPQHARATLLAAPNRPAGLLTNGAPVTPVQRLRARIDALAQVAMQTRRQVRKLVWAAMPDPAPAADLDADLDADAADAAHDARDPELVEALRRQDPREALRYRIVRAVLAELPYGDAQCLALHLVAGLNQAEVATALGLTNSATRRRIVQGLALFSQRFNAAAASLGLAPDALAGHPTHPAPLEAGVGGYVPVQEQPTVTISSPYAAAAGLVAASANGHAPAPAPVDATTVVEAAPPSATGPVVGELPAGAGVIPAEAVVDEAPPAVEESPAEEFGEPTSDAIVVDAHPATDATGEAVSDHASVEASAPDVALAAAAQARHVESEAAEAMPFDAAAVIDAEPPSVLEVARPADAAVETAVGEAAAGAAAEPTDAAGETDADVAESPVAEAPTAAMTATAAAGETGEPPLDVATEVAETPAADAPVAELAELADVAGDDAAVPAVAAESAAVAAVAEMPEAWQAPEALPAADASVDAGAAEAGVAAAEAGTIPAGPAIIEARVVPVLTPRAAAAPVSVPVRVVPVLTPVTPAAGPVNDNDVVGDPVGEPDQIERDG